MSRLYDFFKDDSNILTRLLTTSVLNESQSLDGFCFPGLEDNSSNHIEKKQKNNNVVAATVVPCNPVDNNNQGGWNGHSPSTSIISKNINLKPALLRDLANQYEHLGTQYSEEKQNDNTYLMDEIMDNNNNTINSLNLRVKPLDNDILGGWKGHSPFHELERYFKEEDVKRDPTIIPLVHTLFANLPTTEYHIGYGNTPIKSVKSILKNIENGIVDIETFKASYVREMSVSCGYIKTETGDNIYIPGCSKDNCCIGYNGMIDGLIPIELKGVRFRVFITPNEWNLLKMGKIMQSNQNGELMEETATQEKIDTIFGSRRCLLDMLIAQYKLAIAILTNPDKIIVPNNELYQLGKFLMNEPDGYLSDYMHTPNSNHYEGILDPYPIINFSNMSFYFRHDINLWALDMRKIEYQPYPLAGYYPIQKNNKYADRPWSVEEQIWKLQQQLDYSNNPNSNRQIKQIHQMQGQMSDSFNNEFHNLVKSFIKTDVHYAAAGTAVAGTAVPCNPVSGLPSRHPANNNDDDDNNEPGGWKGRSHSDHYFH